MTAGSAPSVPTMDREFRVDLMGVPFAREKRWDSTVVRALAASTHGSSGTDKSFSIELQSTLNLVVNLESWSILDRIAATSLY